MWQDSVADAGTPGTRREGDLGTNPWEIRYHWAVIGALAVVALRNYATMPRLSLVVVSKAHPQGSSRPQIALL